MQIVSKPTQKVRLILPALHPGQKPVFNDPHRIVVATAGSKFGKCIALDTRIPTPDGWKTMGDILTGDVVFAEDGRRVRVVKAHQVRYGDNCYVVTFHDGHTATVSDDHLWWVEARRSKKTEERRQGIRPRAVLTTEELAKDLYTAPRNCADGKMRVAYKWRVPAAKAAKFTPDDHDVELPLDPYLLGTWLGDGTSSGSSITSADEAVLESWRNGGYMVMAWKARYQFGLVADDSLIGVLRSLGVLRNKHIPRAYMMASAAQRIALLRGLMDTDGSAEGNGHGRNGKSSQFYNTNRVLAEQVRELVESLGGVATFREKRARCNGKDCGACYCLTIKTPFNPFRLARKADRWRAPKNGLHRSIVAIEPVESVPVKCIEVDSPEHLFLIDGYIPTHNTWCMSMWLLQQAWNRPGSVNWWVAPVFKQAQIAFRLIESLIPQHRRRLNRTEMVIELVRSTGNTWSRLEFRSADNPASIRGEGVHAAVGDEAAYWVHDAYVSLWTTLSRTRGKLRLISTPKGRNSFYAEWLKGGNPDFPEYASYQLPTWLNPHVPPEAIEEFRRNMPDDVFRQEICAEFLEDGAGVFRHITRAQRATWQERPKPNTQYVMGIDWAKHQDFSVFMIGDAETHEIVHIERFNDLDWNVQIDRAIRVARDWNNAMVLIDSTGVGDVVYDTMRSGYARVLGYNIFNAQEKTALIQKLQLGFEQLQIAIPDPTTDRSAGKLSVVLQRELETYGYRMSPTGKFVFGPPEGYHDDTVMALALCWWQMNQVPQPYRFRLVPGV